MRTLKIRRLISLTLIALMVFLIGTVAFAVDVPSDYMTITNAGEEGTIDLILSVASDNEDDGLEIPEGYQTITAPDEVIVEILVSVEEDGNPPLPDAEASYKVTVYYEEADGSSSTEEHEGTGKVGSKLPWEDYKQSSVIHEGKNYVLVGYSATNVISENIADNIADIHYTADENSDTIPDKWQAPDGSLVDKNLHTYTITYNFDNGVKTEQTVLEEQQVGTVAVKEVAETMSYTDGDKLYACSFNKIEADSLMVTPDDSKNEATIYYVSEGEGTPVPPTDRPAAPSIEGVTDSSITVTPVENGEYSIDGGNTWTDNPNFDSLDPDTEYEIIVRVPKPDVTNPDPNNPDDWNYSDSTTVKTDKDSGGNDTPSSVGKPEVVDKSDTTITLKPVTGGEYSKDGGETWQKGPTFTDLSPDTDYDIVQRIPDPDNPGQYIVSESVTISTDKESSSEITVPKPVLQSTTTSSITLKPITGGEYSKDNGVSWQPNSTFTGLSSNTSYTFVQRVEDPSNPGQYIVSESVTFRTDAPYVPPVIDPPKPPVDPDNPKPPVEPEPDTPVDVPSIKDITSDKIELNPIPDGEYSIDGGETWTDNPVFEPLEPGTEYEIVQRVPDPENPDEYIMSEPITVTTPEKPVIVDKPAIKEITEDSIELEPVPDGEYSIDGGETWSDTPSFPGLDPGTDYEIIQRVPDPENPGDYIVSDSIVVTTTPKPGPVVPVVPKPSIKDVTEDGIYIEPLPGTDAEYSIDGGITWHPTPDFPNLEPETTYTVVQRVPDPTNPGEWITSDPVIVITSPLPPTDDKPTLDKPVIDRTTTSSIKLVSYSGDAEYSIDGGATWQKSTLFSGLNSNTRYEFIQRIPWTGHDGEYIVSGITSAWTDTVSTPSRPSGGGGGGGSSSRPKPKPKPSTSTTPSTPTPNPEPVPVTPEPSITPVNPDNPILDRTGKVSAKEVKFLESSNHVAYIMGYPDGTVGPNNSITRAEVVTILTRLFDAENKARYASSSSTFSDVSGNAWYNSYVAMAQKAGIINGYSDGTFRPNSKITRAEFAEFASKFLPDGYRSGSCPLLDISGSWASGAIAKVYSAGWVKGYEDGTYRPNETITRAEVTVIVNRMLERLPNPDSVPVEASVYSDNTESDWFFYDVMEATHSHDYNGNDWTSVDS